MDKNQVQNLIRNSKDYELEIIWIPKIMGNQTSEELESHSTLFYNKVGLNGRDAGFISSLYEQIQNGKHLTHNQVVACHKVLPKYWKQYCAIANN